jgi:hypothetical protein
MQWSTRIISSPQKVVGILCFVEIFTIGEEIGNHVLQVKHTQALSLRVVKNQFNSTDSKPSTNSLHSSSSSSS